MAWNADWDKAHISLQYKVEQKTLFTSFTESVYSFSRQRCISELVTIGWAHDRYIHDHFIIYQKYHHPHSSIITIFSSTYLPQEKGRKLIITCEIDMVCAFNKDFYTYHTTRSAYFSTVGQLNITNNRQRILIRKKYIDRGKQNKTDKPW